MDRKYKQLTPEHRNQIQRGQNQGLSIRGIGRQLGRSPSTVSLEIRRGLVGETYDVVRGREVRPSGKMCQRSDRLSPVHPITPAALGHSAAGIFSVSVLHITHDLLSPHLGRPFCMHI
jgi:hypothetical protein